MAAIDLNAGDFDSIRLDVQLFNVDTKKEIEDKTGNLIQVIELIENGIAISVPNHSGAVGQKLRIKIKAKGPSGEIDVAGRAIIKDTEESQGKAYRMNLQFETCTTGNWSDLNQLFVDQQSKIQDLFLALKG